MRHDADPPTPATTTSDARTDLPPVGHPNPDATGSAGAMPHGPPTGAAARTPELQEREAARRRAHAFRAPAGSRPAEQRRIERPGVIEHAFVALADNVRDYAIFLMDPDGIIEFWGEGARIMKWWTREEAEGSHLRLMYPEGGSEDGTAEAHLRDAAVYGELVSEGHRVRGDGSTFWARVTLTALRNDAGQLLGFCKVTRDLTTQRAADLARARAVDDAALEAARIAGRDLAAEVAVLQEENAALSEALQIRDRDDEAGGAEPG